MKSKFWDIIFNYFITIKVVLFITTTTRLPAFISGTSTESNFFTSISNASSSSTDPAISTDSIIEQSSIQYSSTMKPKTYSMDVNYPKKNWTKNEDILNIAKHRIIKNPVNQNKHHHEHHWGPFFEEPLNTTEGALQLTAHLSTEVVLNCRVGMLSDKTVMWVRRTTEKVSLLTVGNITYSGDPRIRIKFQYPNNWRLIINPIQKEDASLYMCQVSTHPPRVFATNLTVLEPPLRVVDEKGHEVRDRYYKTGSTIDLSCQISRHFLKTQKDYFLKQKKLQETETRWNNLSKKVLQNSDEDYLQLIQWTKDGAIIPSIILTNTSNSDKWHNKRIAILQANFTDDGIYSCSIANLYKAVVHVQVLTGELPAAVQHNSKGPTELHLIFVIIFIFSQLFTKSCYNISPSINLVSF